MSTAPTQMAGDAGAASGLVNVVHQLAGSLGLSILVVVFAAAGSSALDGRELLANRTVALALILVLRPIAPHCAGARRINNPLKSLGEPAVTPGPRLNQERRRSNAEA